jgi:predicted nucleic-acid-binding protein
LPCNCILKSPINTDSSIPRGKVKTLLAKKQSFTAPITVILELVWVLEANNFKAFEIEYALNLLLNLPNFKPANTIEIKRALMGYRQGMDFADARHLALSGESTQLISFDKKFVKLAKSHETQPAVVAL